MGNSQEVAAHVLGRVDEGNQHAYLREGRGGDL